MERVVQFVGPYGVEVTEHASEPLPAGHLRVRTRYSGISAGTELTAYRGTNPYLTRTWDAERIREATGGRGADAAIEIGGVPPHLAGRWTVERLQQTCLRLVAEAEVEVESLVSHVVPVADAAAAYQLLDERPHDTIQMVLEF